MIYSNGWGGDYWRRYRETLARFGVKIIAEPTEEQITLMQAYAHLNLTPEGSPLSHPDDQWLRDFIPVVREYVEGETERALATQTLEMGLNGFPGSYGWVYPSVWYGGLSFNYHNGIPLPMSPVQQIVSVLYTDGDGIEQTVDPTTYTLDTWSPMNVLNLNAGLSWPTVQTTPAAVRIQYIAGYTLPGDSPDTYPLPRSIRAAMLLTLSHLYENREQTTDLKLMELPLGIDALLRKYTLRLSMA